MNYLTEKEFPNILVIMSFVDIFIFVKGLLDGKGAPQYNLQMFWKFCPFIFIFHFI